MKVIFLFVISFLYMSVIWNNVKYIKKLSDYNPTFNIFTGGTINYCEVKDFTGNIFTGGCMTGLFIPSKNFSGDTIYLTGERIYQGIIYHWKYGRIGDACYSGDDIQGDVIDCGIN